MPVLRARGYSVGGRVEDQAELFVEDVNDGVYVSGEVSIQSFQHSDCVSSCFLVVDVTVQHLGLTFAFGDKDRFVA